MIHLVNADLKIRSGSFQIGIAVGLPPNRTQREPDHDTSEWRTSHPWDTGLNQVFAQRNCPC